MNDIWVGGVLENPYFVQNTKIRLLRMNKCRWFQTYASWLDTRLLMVLQFFLLMILMATRCKSGILKPSLTSPFAPHPNSLLTVYLLVSTVGKVSVWGSVDMKTYTFFLAPAKQISALWSRGHMASFPILCPLTQVPLELLSFKKIPLLFLIISHWTLETVVPRTKVSKIQDISNSHSNTSLTLKKVPLVFLYIALN